MSKKRKQQKYPEQFKADAVNLVLNQNYSRSEVGRRLGIHQATIARWVREHKQETEETANGRPSSRQLQEEVKRLKKENKRLTMEREILKKAAAFFAKESS
jgi:transposase